MDLLVLGGTRFVGRALIEDARARGWRVTAINRGQTGTLPSGVSAIRVDRDDSDGFARAIDGRSWDAVVDTWSGAPRTATGSAAALRGHATRYAYISSGSVYRWGTHVDESSPLVDGDPEAGDGSYPELKRGAELGILAAFPDALLARAGLIIGPYEDIGRLPWWLNRIAAGGRVVAPGDPERPLQYIDVRDLAAWVLDGLDGGLTGAFDVASVSGASTTKRLLCACIDATGSTAELEWFSETELERAGALPWTHLPCWAPRTGEFAGFLEADTSKARAHGLVARAVEETVADTWAWLQSEGQPPQRPDRDVHGLPTAIEQSLLALR